MKKGVAIIISLLLSVAVFVAPFSVSADGFDDLMEDTNTRFWAQYNLKHIMPEYSPHSTCILSTSPVTYCSSYFDSSNPVTYRNDNILYSYGYNSANNSLESLTVPTFTAFSMSAYLRAVPGNTWVIYLSNKNTTASNLTSYVQNNVSGISASRVTNDRQTSMDVGNNYLIAIKVTNTTSAYRRVTLNFGGLAGTNDGWVLPIFTGGEDLMPDSVKYLVGLPSEFDKQYELITDIDSFLSVISGEVNTISSNLNTIINQNSTLYTSWNPYIKGIYQSLSNSNSHADTNNQQNQTLSNTVDNLNSLESGFVSNMDNAFNDINFNNDLLSGSSLVNSMSWVRTQFDRFTNNNPIGAFIQYALLFGLGLLIIGRFK